MKSFSDAVDAAKRLLTTRNDDVIRLKGELETARDLVKTTGAALVTARNRVTTTAPSLVGWLVSVAVGESEAHKAAKLEAAAAESNSERAKSDVTRLESLLTEATVAKGVANSEHLAALAAKSAARATSNVGKNSSTISNELDAKARRELGKAVVVESAGVASNSSAVSSSKVPLLGTYQSARGVGTATFRNYLDVMRAYNAEPHPYTNVRDFLKDRVGPTWEDILKDTDIPRELSTLRGGSQDKHYAKYLKYKQKYLQLKLSI